MNKKENYYLITGNQARILRLLLKNSGGFVHEFAAGLLLMPDKIRDELEGLLIQELIYVTNEISLDGKKTNDTKIYALTAWGKGVARKLEENKDYLSVGRVYELSTFWLFRWLFGIATTYVQIVSIGIKNEQTSK